MGSVSVAVVTEDWGAEALDSSIKHRSASMDLAASCKMSRLKTTSGRLRCLV